MPFDDQEGIIFLGEANYETIDLAKPSTFSCDPIRLAGGDLLWTCDLLPVSWTVFELENIQFRIEGQAME